MPPRKIIGAAQFINIYGRREMRKSLRELRWAVIIGLVCVFNQPLTVRAADTGSSSACIKCHTDFKALDDYGAKATEGGAAIAG
jgi:hypothetical protein